MGKETGDLRGSLRRWAETTGDEQTRSVVELVIRYGLGEEKFPWIRRGIYESMWPDYWIDFQTLATVAKLTPGEDGLVMGIAADFGRGIEVSPAVLSELDDDRRSYVLSVFAQRPAGEWPQDREVAPAIPRQVLAEIAAREQRGIDRLLRDIALEDEN